MKNKGFTLIELMVVIAIIAMMLAIALPALQTIMGQNPEQKNKAAFEAIEQVEIDNGKVRVSRGSEYKIPISPSVSSSSGTCEMFAKSLPVNAEVKTFNEKYYIVWSPEAGVRQDVTIITSSGSLKDEVIITLEAD